MGMLASMSTDQDRLLLRVTRAAHPFAALGLRAEDIQQGTDCVKRSLQDFEEYAHPTKVSEGKRQMAIAAAKSISDAAAVVERMMGMDIHGTQLLAELFIMMDDEG